MNSEDPVIQAIKRDIEELLAAKRAANPETFRKFSPENGLKEQLLISLEQAAGLATVDINRIPVRSLRPIWGPLVTFFKRAVRKSTFWLYQPLFQQITGFNNTIVDFLGKITLQLEEATKVARHPSLEEKLQALFARLDESEKKHTETHQRLSSKIESLEEIVNRCAVLGSETLSARIEELEKGLERSGAKLKESLVGVAADKADLQREVIEAKQQVQNALQELASLRRLVEDYRAEAVFLRAKLALALQYQRTGKWPLPREGEGPERALSPLQDPEDTTWLYHVFEQQFRGPEELIKERQRAYIPDVRKAYETCGGYLLDLGAGRGEFLELCREVGIPARGVDSNEAMVSRCREKGLEVERADAIAHLQSLPDESLCAVTAFQLVEHLAPRELWHLVQMALVKLKPGGVIILETVNPHSLVALQNFYLDLTHQRPIPAPTLRFLLEAAGFRRVEVRFSSPIPEKLRLQGDDPNVAKLNELLFGYQDYAIVGWR